MAKHNGKSQKDYVGVGALHEQYGIINVYLNLTELKEAIEGNPAYVVEVEDPRTGKMVKKVALAVAPRREKKGAISHSVSLNSYVENLKPKQNAKAQARKDNDDMPF